MNTHRRTRSGMTVMEVVLALSIFVGVGGTILIATQALSSAFRTGTSLSTLDSQTRAGLESMAGLLEQADSSTLGTPTSDPFYGEKEVLFQRAIGFEGGAVVHDTPDRILLEESPFDATDGVDNDGNGLVDEGWIVWVQHDGEADEQRHVLVRNVALAGDGEVPGNGIDDNENGIIDEGGLSFVWNEKSVTIRLTVERAVSSAVATQRTFERTVAFQTGGI